MRRMFMPIVALLVLAGALPALAQASIPGYRLVVVNGCTDTISMAYRVKDYTGQWVTRGWFNTSPGQTRTLYMPTTNRTFYYYGFTAGRRVTWSGTNKPGSITRWVQSRAFLHSSGVLTGQGARQVSFRRRVVPETGVYRLSLTCPGQ